MASAGSAYDAYPEAEDLTSSEADPIDVRQIILGQRYVPSPEGISPGALGLIARSIQSFPYDSDAHTKVHAFGIADHGIELANPDVSSATLHQLIEPLLIDGMKKCFDYGVLWDFRKLEGVLKELTPELSFEQAPTLMAVHDIVQASGGGGGAEVINDEEGRLGSRTRRLAGGIIRYAFLKQGDPAFVIPKPRSES